MCPPKRAHSYNQTNTKDTRTKTRPSTHEKCTKTRTNKTQTTSNKHTAEACKLTRIHKHTHTHIQRTPQSRQRRTRAPTGPHTARRVQTCVQRRGLKISKHARVRAQSSTQPSAQGQAERSRSLRRKCCDDESQEARPNASGLGSSPLPVYGSSSSFSLSDLSRIMETFQAGDLAAG